MVELADIVRRYGPAHLEQFGEQILPSQRAAMRAIEQCREPLGRARFRRWHQILDNMPLAVAHVGLVNLCLHTHNFYHLLRDSLYFSNSFLVNCAIVQAS